MPYALVAIGASINFAPRAAPLIKNACWAGGRDEESLRELSQYRPDVNFMPDPVLVDPRLVVPEDDEAVYDTCWILRGPVDENHGVVRALKKPHDIVVGLEPREDEPLKEIFPEIRMVEALGEICSILRKSRRVVSMRFHGVILGLRMGRPCYSVRLPKGKALLAMLGLERYAADRMRDIVFTSGYETSPFESQRRFLTSIFHHSTRTMFHHLADKGRTAGA